MNRRQFIRNSGPAAAALTLTSQELSALATEARRTAQAELPRRPYRDGIELSVIGFGAIIVCGHEQATANRQVASAFERGVNYFDVAPSYFDGEAERKLGIALQPYREKSFLACKTARRDAAGAAEELEESLRRLKTDHFDLYQLHAMTKPEDVERVLGRGGAMETFVRARDAGKVRYLGFSAHSEEAALRLLEAFPFDSVLYPTNYVCFAEGSFGPRVLAKAKKRGAARLALKAMAYTRLDKGVEKKWKKAWYTPIDEIEHARRALYFTLSEDVTAAIPPGHIELFNIALDLATAFAPLSAGDRKKLLASAADVEPLFQA